jgi:hypothetical protein
MPDFLEGDVKLPGIGKSKKWVVYGIGGTAAVYVGWRWWQASQADSSSDTGASDGTYTSPDLTDYGLSTSGGAMNVGGNTGNTTTDGTTGIDSNGEWTDYASEKLVNAGYDPATVAAALGEFLARRSLDKSEASIARAALAYAGQPPIGGPYSVLEAAATGTTNLPAPTGLKVTTGTTTATLSYNSVAGAGYYRAYRDGVSTNIGATDGTSITVGGLEPNKEYTFYVAADTTSGKPGARSTGVKAKTKPITLATPSAPTISGITSNSARAATKSVSGAKNYRWYLNGKLVGSTDAPSYTYTGLKGKTTYQASVAVDISTQSPSKQSGRKSFKTK